MPNPTLFPDYCYLSVSYIHTPTGSSWATSESGGVCVSQYLSLICSCQQVWSLARICYTHSQSTWRSVCGWVWREGLFNTHLQICAHFIVIKLYDILYSIIYRDCYMCVGILPYIIHFHFQFLANLTSTSSSMKGTMKFGCSMCAIFNIHKIASDWISIP